MASNITITSPTGRIDNTLTSSVTFSWTVTGVTQYAFQIKYRIKGTTTWMDNGEYISSVNSQTLSTSNFTDNNIYEYKIRIWWGSAGYETQGDWVFGAFVMQKSAKALLGSNPALRVVALNSSIKPSNVRINLGKTSGVCELDMVDFGSPFESKVRIKQSSTVTRSVAKTVNYGYSDYLNYSDAGYFQYYNYYNYSNYYNYYDYSNYYNYGNVYSNYANYYSDGAYGNYSDCYDDGSW